MKSKVYLALGIVLILVLAGLAGCSAVAAESNGPIDSSQVTVNAKAPVLLFDQDNREGIALPCRLLTSGPGIHLIFD